MVSNIQSKGQYKRNMEVLCSKQSVGNVGSKQLAYQSLLLPVVSKT